MKVSNAQIESILSHGVDPKEVDVDSLLNDLAADLKEARQNKRQVVRFPIPVIAAGVSHAIRVETPDQLRMNVPEPYATMVEGRARAAAGHVEGADAFPMYLVPRTGLWILNLHNAVTGVTVAVCRASTMEALADLLARERSHEPGARPFKAGPLESYDSPVSTDCFVNVLESTDAYIAHAIAGLKDAREL